MQRRDFCQGAAASALAPVALWSAGAQAQAAGPQAGKDFQVVEPRAPVEAPAGKIEVVEFFWYSCQHCNAFEPTLKAWVKNLPKDVAFRRSPVAFRDDFAPQQRLYFVLEAMGLVEQLHERVFAAIHVQKLNLSKGDAIIDWISKQGVDTAKFTAQYNSFSIATKATRATQLQNAYRVEGVPALGVAGRFYTDATSAGSMQRALQVVDALTASLRAKTS